MFIKNKATNVVNTQKRVGTFDYPFTLNPYLGCRMQCVYCFAPMDVKKQKQDSRKDFFSNVEVKTNLNELLRKKLKQYSNLPQHLKRIQVGVTTEIFQPQVINYIKNTLGFDLIKDMLDLFKEEWDNGNKWMVHLLTKNHNIVSYLPILKNMKEIVQVEFSMIHYDDSISRKYEKYTSSIPRRLDAISALSKEGIFVRVMAMPFYGDQNDLAKLKNIVFNSGALGFKNKELNHYEWCQLNNISALDPLKRSKKKTNNHIPSLMTKSGEIIQPIQSKKVLMPKYYKTKNWAVKPNERLEKRDMPLVDMGYSVINNVDWGYLK